VIAARVAMDQLKAMDTPPSIALHLLKSFWFKAMNL